jgi:hypothetical protein
LASHLPSGFFQSDIERLDHAAYKPDLNKKEVFYGPNHDAALKKAYQAGAIENEEYSRLIGSENAAKRNTDNFGYWTNKDRFVGRKEGFKLAKESDQLLKSKFDYEGKDGVDLAFS